ncbi:ATP-dependent RNA helicase HrpA [Marinobacter persicus]|uniref:ATP-dependent helicase HrpA n=1 Tax=Marinobacter persicus TaxID=930118 RepID=A0A2S6G934_9GAMM|nr:ATP-dependent RNA helicase HrpA [Marinobacter persicus]PPK52697.1 ATP-dependent helicase HrpA [Marinobacter persicus]PPK55757.1 ATP-dependent helicase HrpA [Marinobacter persicus]PPK59208.1 ATP-dependent helicase HrpA [Marinobacter persicus]
MTDTTQTNRPDNPKATVADLMSQLDDCNQQEAARIIRSVSRHKGKPGEKELAKMSDWLERGKKKVQARRTLHKPASFPAGLPVSDRVDDISAAIEKHQVVIIAGETGSGKTTQIPKICLNQGRGLRGLIGHTQPRRIAARSVSSRIAEELGEQVGQQIGYQVRFTDNTSESSRVKVMTDGILLAEIQHDRFLDRYDTIIIDEAHERSLNIDFLLGYLKQLLPKRPDLKVIITSATIEVERFSEFFGEAPVIEVSGRTYPVDVRYRPLAGDEDDRDQSWTDGVLSAMEEIEQHERQEKKPPGDVLVFLPGEREIRALSKVLRHAELRHTEVLPLYSRLSNQEQNRVFQAHKGRRIVLSTNVAETSLTVPGIRYVIDTGVARISRYSVRSKIQRLPIEPISQASANQRAGRCGRVAPGICFRLYDETDFINRPEYTDPEILRTNLASVILQMTTSGLGEIRHFPFLEAPERKQINDGYKLLEELSAVDAKRRVTKLGRTMARLPLDPRLARMLVTSADQGSLAEVLIVIAGLSIQDPRERPQEKQQAADQAHAPFNDKESDFATLLNIWNWFEEQRQEMSQNQLKKLCQKTFLSWMRMREWRDIHRQLTLICREQKLALNKEPAGYDPIHKAILAGLLGQVAVKVEKREYLATRNRKVMIFPGSKVAKSGPKWIVAAEIVETSKVFARMVAGIQPEWVEPLAGHVVKHHYFEPHWEQKRAQVMGYEKVSLYGLDVVPKRRIPYAKVDPKECRDLFIRRALVEGDYRSKAPFIARNREMLDTVENLEKKTRRRDLLVDDEVLVAFYDERLPDDIISGRHFESWWKRLSAEELKKLELTEADVLQRPVDQSAAELYPDYLEWQGVKYPLSYEFEPTSERDGVTLRVQLMALKQIPERRLEWLVPGLLREKCIALVKGLPKSLRRNFVPVPDFVDAALENMQPDNEPLALKLGEQLRRMTGVQIDPDAWPEDELPRHLRMNLRVTGDKGKTIAESRDASELQDKLEGRAEQALASATDQETDDREPAEYTDWQFGKLPEKVQTEKGGMQVTVYPALEDLGQKVRTTRCLDRLTAEDTTRRGIARLIIHRFGNTLSDLERKLPRFRQSALMFAPVGKAKVLLDDLLLSTVMQHFLAEDLPRDRDSFLQCFDEHRGDFIPALEEADERLYQAMTGYQKIAKQLKGKISLAQANSMADLKFQMQNLVYPGFLVDTPAQWLARFGVYFEAADIRLEKMPREMGREREFLHTIEPLWARYATKRDQQKRQGVKDPELELYRWMLEEFRVSFFAQQLGTAMTVSVKRLDKQWEKTRV